MILQLLNGELIHLPAGITTVEQAREWVIQNKVFGRHAHRWFIHINRVRTLASEVGKEEKTVEDKEEKEVGKAVDDKDVRPTHFVLYSATKIRIPKLSHTLVDGVFNVLDPTYFFSHWEEVCNPSILTYFSDYLDQYPEVWKCPHPIIVDAIFNRYTNIIPTALYELLQNRNDRVVSYFLNEHPELIQIEPFSRNDNPRAVEWCTKEVLDNTTLPTLMWANILHRTRVVDTIRRVWEMMEGMCDDARTDLANVCNDYMSELIVRDLREKPEYHLELAPVCCMSSNPEVLAACMERLERYDDNKKQEIWAAWCNNPNDVVVNYLIEHVYPSIGEGGLHYLASNTNDRAVKFVLSNMNNSNTTDLIHLNLLLNPHPDAIAYCISTFTWSQVERLFRDMDARMMIGDMPPEVALHLLLTDHTGFGNDRWWSIVAALSKSAEYELVFAP